MIAADTDLRAGDLMTLDPVTITMDATIEEAETLMRDFRISGLPVVDDEGRLAGVVSQTDLLYLAVPSVRALIRHRDSGIRIGEVMSVPAVTVAVDATLADAARIMDRRHLHRLVVIDAEGRPVGVLSSMDYVALAAER